MFMAKNEKKSPKLTLKEKRREKQEKRKKNTSK